MAISRVTACTALLAAGVLLGGTAHGVCEFDPFGTPTNIDDPSCKDVQLRYTQSSNIGNDIALGYPVPVPVDSLTPVDGFRTYASLFARHQSLDTASDGVTGVVVGQTVAGRDIWAYVIGDPDTETVDGGTEAAVMMNGTIHAREWQSPEAVTALFEELAATQSDGGIGEYLADNLTVVILPVNNVDGFVVTQAFPDRSTAAEQQPRDGRMRRKNLRDPATGGAIDETIDTTDDSFFGIDLNRNNAQGWGLNQGSTSDDASLIYRGPVATSEPEAQALLAAADLGPRDRLRLYTDVHSFTQIFFTPVTGNARQDAITETLGTRIRAVTNFKYRWGPDGGAGGIGLTSDYFAFRLRIPAWTLETEPLTGGQDYGGTGVTHSGFVLPDSQVGRMRDELTAMNLVGLYRQADRPYVAALEVRDAVSGELRYSARWQASGSGRALSVLEDKALLPGNRYRLWVAFSKPMRWRNAGGQVANYAGQSVSLFPRIRLQAPTVGDASNDVNVSGQGSDWLDQPGANGAGYGRYRDDALATEFTVPSTLGTTAAVPLVFEIEAEDMTEAALDGDPATRADWGPGYWTALEDATGTAGDSGGADCSFVVFAGPTADTPAPDKNIQCRAAGAQAPGGGGGGSGGGGGGGGGSAPGGLLIGLLLGAALLRGVGRKRPG